VVCQEAAFEGAGRSMTVDITPWQGVGSPPPSGGYGPLCDECGLSRWVEIGGGPAEDVYHPNVDIFAGPNVDIVCDFERGAIPIHNRHAERIKAVHAIQHLSRDGMRYLLLECVRIMVPGAMLFVMITDLEFVVRRLFEDGIVEEWLNCVFHGPNDRDKFGFHKWGYSFLTMKFELERAGFVNVQHQGYYNRWDLKMSAVRP